MKQGHQFLSVIIGALKFLEVPLFASALNSISQHEPTLIRQAKCFRPRRFAVNNFYILCALFAFFLPSLLFSVSYSSCPKNRSQSSQTVRLSSGVASYTCTHNQLWEKVPGPCELHTVGKLSCFAHYCDNAPS